MAADYAWKLAMPFRIYCFQSISSSIAEGALMLSWVFQTALFPLTF
jgi:hypothetical protein